MTQTHYFLSPVKVYDDGHLVMIMDHALVSRQSIFRVFEEQEEIRKAFLDRRLYTVEVGENIYLARLMRECGQDGSHYNLRLIEMSEQAQKDLTERITKLGVVSPWRREFPRIPISQLSSEVEIPVGVIASRTVGQAHARVVNFSYLGMLFELECRGLSMSEQVGQQIQFRIVTSKGMVTEQVNGRIARIYDEILGNGKLRRGLGIRFEEMKQDLRKSYDGMILDACKEFKEERRESPALAESQAPQND